MWIQDPGLFSTMLVLQSRRPILSLLLLTFCSFTACKPACEELNVKRLTLDGFLGEKSLILNAYTSEEHAKLEPNFSKVLVKYESQDEDVKATYLVFYEGSVLRYEGTIYTTEVYGTFYWKDAGLNVPVAAYTFNDNCVIFKFPSHPTTSNISIISFYCGRNPVSEADIEKFEQYAKCQNYPFMKIRRDPGREAFSCFDFPCGDENLEEDKILGKWYFSDIAATNAPLNNPSKGSWIQFESQDGKIRYIDSTGQNYSVRLSGGKLYYSDKAEGPFITLYIPNEETLLMNSVNEENASFVLYTKSKSADEAQMKNFKHLSSCLSLSIE
ncbi:uncharacterized protein O3C94_015469 isoform 1-T2 [Discoglossus pictus]